MNWSVWIKLFQRKEKVLNSIINVVRSCGNIIKEVSADNVNIKNDNPKNLVTEYDTKVQEILKNKLRQILPEASFLGEEGEQHYSKSGFCFVCDPIDGTCNFVKNLKHSGISVALLKDGQPMLGVIYNPYLDEMFWAERGKGAFCNGKSIHTSIEPLENSLIVFGTSPYNESLHSKTWELAIKSLKLGLDVRRLGAAVLDLTCVAKGCFGLYWELEIQPWDYAAGILIAEEAGAIVRTIDNKEIKDCFSATSIAVYANNSCLQSWNNFKL